MVYTFFLTEKGMHFDGKVFFFLDTLNESYIDIKENTFIFHVTPFYMDFFLLEKTRVY